MHELLLGASTLSIKILKNGQTYLKNFEVFTPQDF